MKFIMVIVFFGGSILGVLLRLYFFKNMVFIWKRDKMRMFMFFYLFIVISFSIVICSFCFFVINRLMLVLKINFLELFFILLIFMIKVVVG